MRANGVPGLWGPKSSSSWISRAPFPAPNQVLIRVIASSINPVAWKRASGALRLISPAFFP